MQGRRSDAQKRYERTRGGLFKGQSLVELWHSVKDSERMLLNLQAELKGTTSAYERAHIQHQIEAWKGGLHDRYSAYKKRGGKKRLIEARKGRSARGRRARGRRADRPLHQIAREIRRDWGSKVNYAAVPYLDAMGSLSSVDDYYYSDSGDYIVRYFLSNARSWRGPKAKEIKAELKGMLK